MRRVKDADWKRILRVIDEAYGDYVKEMAALRQQVVRDVKRRLSLIRPDRCLVAQLDRGPVRGPAALHAHRNRRSDPRGAARPRLPLPALPPSRTRPRTSSPYPAPLA